MKFKVGDKVKLIQKNWSATNQIGTIKKVDNCDVLMPYYINFPKTNLWLGDYQIQGSNSEIIRKKLGIK